MGKGRSDIKGEVVRGVLEGVSDIDSYEFPDFSRYEDYKVVEQFVAKNPDKWIIGWLLRFHFQYRQKAI